MERKDFRNVTIIGAAVGLLVQPLVFNIASENARLVFLTQGSVQIGIFFFFAILAPIALGVAALIARWIPIVYQIAKFAAVGSLNSFVDFGILNLLIYLTHENSGWYYVLFVGCSFLAATTNSFFWNKFWTFGAHAGNTTAQAVKFYTSTALVGALNVSVASFVVNEIARPGVIEPNLWANIGKLIGIFTAMTLNFLSYKFFVFKKPA